NISEYRCGKSPRLGYAERGAKITRRPYPAPSQRAPNVGKPHVRIGDDQHRVDRESFRLPPASEQVPRKPVHRLGAAAILRRKPPGRSALAEEPQVAIRKAYAHAYGSGSLVVMPQR